MTVTDERGETVAVSALGEGRVRAEGENPTPSNGWVRTREHFCDLQFVVAVPEAKFYGFEFAGHEAIQISKADLEAQDGELTFTFAP